MVGFIEKDPSTPRVAVTIECLIDSVSNYYMINRSDVVGESRSRDCMIPRQVIMYLAKAKLRMPFAKIGEILGKRNHTTVMHSVTKMEDQLKNDRQLLRDVNAIAKEVGIN
jgi:chromosomal replication initiator protein